MKKRIIPIITLIIIMLSALSASAFTNAAVYDEAGYMTEDAAALLSERLETLRNTYQFDVALYTETVMQGTDAQAVADDIFDYTDYGAGDGKDGILLYVASEPRVYAFTTHGSGEEVFTITGLDYIEEEVVSRLKENDYEGAFRAYADCAEVILQAAAEGSPYGAAEEELAYRIIVIAFAVLLPLLIAWIATMVQSRKMKTAVLQSNASDYAEPGSMQLNNSQDIFLYSTITKTPKPKENSSSGSHISSSGESHGGRSGSY